VRRAHRFTLNGAHGAPYDFVDKWLWTISVKCVGWADVRKPNTTSAMLGFVPQPNLHHWKRLQGSEFWRLRVGDWRAICDLREGELVLLVLKIGPRGDVYK